MGLVKEAFSVGAGHSASVSKRELSGYDAGINRILYEQVAQGRQELGPELGFDVWDVGGDAYGGECCRLLG